MTRPVSFTLIELRKPFGDRPGGHAPKRRLGFGGLGFRGQGFRGLGCTVLAGALCAGAVGCGGDAELGDAELGEEVAESKMETTEAQPENESFVSGSGRPEAAVEAPSGATPESIPTFSVAQVNYPAGPFGTLTNSTIENLELLGWQNPQAANYDSNSMEIVRLSDFYNPDDEGGTELLMINSVAVWCGACRVEYQEFSDKQVYTTFGPRGLQMLGVLFEDNDAAPARFSDMENWSRAFKVAFPFVIDPGFKTGAYFDRSATPMNMLVDARTMKILFSFTGYSEEVFEEIDRRLTQRGR